MKNGILLLLLFLGAIQSQAGTAFDAVEQVTLAFGPGYRDRLVRVEGFGGNDQPAEWGVYAVDFQFPDRVASFTVRGNKIVASALLSRAASRKIMSGTFSVTSELLDSDEIFAFAEAEARDMKVGFFSADYLLIFNVDEGTVAYGVSVRDQAGNYMGQIWLDAETGTELSSDWPGSADRAERIESEARNAKDDVKDFFKKFGRGVRDIFR
jgi:hypothetical protein